MIRFPALAAAALAGFGAALGLAAPAHAAGDDVFITVDAAKALAARPDVRFLCADGEKDFTKEHVAGAGDAFAHDLHLLDDVKACGGLPMCEPRAAAMIGKLGIGNDTQVVVYDSGTGVNASGDWFFLTLYGHKNVKILDGGLATWKAHGGAVETGAAKAVATKTFTPAVQKNMIATKDEVLSATKDSSKFLIVDARHNLDEYTGKQLMSALAAPGKEVTVPRGGFIPTAVFSPWKKYAGNPSAEADKPTLKSDEELKKQLDKLKKNGFDPKKEVISYCHVGLGRGSFQYLALKKAGVDNVKLYVGSWDEWGGDSSLPLGETAGAGATP